MITKKQLHMLCHDDTIVLTVHLMLRCRERGIAYDDIKQTISEGAIIEQYPDDHPYPSCLMVHQLPNNSYMHIVVGLGDERLWIVTAYYPDKARWDDDFKIRKAGE